MNFDSILEKMSLTELMELRDKVDIKINKLQPDSPSGIIIPSTSQFKPSNHKSNPIEKSRAYIRWDRTFYSKINPDPQIKIRLFWGRIVKRIDRSQLGGYAIIGDYLQENQKITAMNSKSTIFLYVTEGTVEKQTHHAYILHILSADQIKIEMEWHGLENENLMIKEFDPITKKLEQILNK